jgi:hypothetical protein
MLYTNSNNYESGDKSSQTDSTTEIFREYLLAVGLVLLSKRAVPEVDET